MPNVMPRQTKHQPQSRKVQIMRLNVQRFRPYILLVLNILNVTYHIKSVIKSYLVKINLAHFQIPGFPRCILTPRSSLYGEQFQRYGLIFPEKRDTFFLNRV